MIDAHSVRANPTAAELRSLAAAMPNASETRNGSLNVRTRVDARSPSSTHLVVDSPGEAFGRSMSRAEGKRIAELQRRHLAGRDTVALDGYIGDDPEFRTAVRLYVERSNANIAAMQQQLYFDVADRSHFDPELTVVCTPNLGVPGYPNDRVIAVDLEQRVTRICNSDYFGESKKGGLRMWNELVYGRGGLPLHAGCKVVPRAGGEAVVLIVGASGSGKTALTFTSENDSVPVQDDFVALMPGGKVHATEAGCFATTFGLSAEREAAIHAAVTRPEAYLENVAQDESGELDFCDTRYSRNGRATFSLSGVRSRSARSLPSASLLVILNKDEGVIPAVAKLSERQAVGYFMLGETQGTSAGGVDEEGRFLRVPGANPFFPRHPDCQGGRFLELAAEHPLEVYLMNTGSVGGSAREPRSLDVGLDDSSAILKALVERTIEWIEDPDFGYRVAVSVPGIDESRSAGLLRPHELYTRQGRAAEHAEIVARIKAERSAQLEQFKSLSAEIVAAVSGSPS